MLEWIKCDKTPLFAENLSEQLHSIALRVFCVGTLNFWKALEKRQGPWWGLKGWRARSGGVGGGYWNLAAAQLSLVTPDKTLLNASHRRTMTGEILSDYWA